MGRPTIDLTGQQFGQLTAIEPVGKDANGNMRWRCRCDCGNETITRSYNLTSGKSKSCGCAKALRAAAMRTASIEVHTKHGGRNTRLYNIWRAMRYRCYNPHNTNFNNYGGRGITVCNEWLCDFTIFRDWAVTHGYRDDLSIDRIDVNGNYEPSNCRWATYHEQRINQRPRKKGGAV